MSDPQLLAQAVQTSFQRALACLTSDDVPDSFRQQVELYGELRGRLGVKGVSEKIGLTVDELPLLNKAVSDADRRSRRAAEAGDSGTETRNLKISQLRLLGWLETIAQRNPDADIAIDLDALVSEDISRKRLRALELVIRSLVSERHSGDEALLSHLQEIFGERVVDKWQRGSDGEDILSGTTFSELASIFVNKQEFSHHEKLYDETPFLSLLREKRKTIQSFLEDIRRIRNVLAHNKRVSNIQLELLDVYYDELMTPVAESHQKGETRVNPSQFLEVSDSDLDDYFDNLHEDVMSIKDDIAELKTELSSQLGEVTKQTQEVKQATDQINKKLVLAVVAIGIVALIGGFVVYQNVLAKKDLNAVGDTVAKLDEQTGEIGSSINEIKQDAADLVESSKTVGERAERIEGTTKTIALTGERLEKRTDEVRKAVEKSAEASEQNSAKVRDAVETASKQSDKKSEEIRQAVEDASNKSEKSNTEIRKAVDKVAANSDRVVESLDAIRDGFKLINKTGGVIPDADTPQEFYHNARIYEQDGNYGKARQNYAKFFRFKLELVDPHLRYQTFLKLQEGREGARELYNELKAQSPNLVTEYAAMLLLPRKTRIKQLSAFAQKHPDFAPVYYELSRDFSEARLGEQAASDKAAELEHLQKFVKLHEQGKYLKFMLDQQLADSQLSDARVRLEALKSIAESALKNPVTLTASKSALGWMVNISIVGQVKEMFYRLDGEEKFVSNGLQQQVNQTTGFALPNLMLKLDKDVPKTKLFIKYMDTRDREQGPYELLFDPEAEQVRFSKDLLERFSNSWVSFRDFDGKTLLYFSQLMSYRFAIKEVLYGLNVEKPDKKYEFPPASLDDPISIPAGFLPFMEVPADTKFATVQLKYKDGSESKIIRFKR